MDINARVSAEEEIDFSELGSMRDGNLSEWDTS